jgi:hypothetical protein
MRSNTWWVKQGNLHINASSTRANGVAAAAQTHL